jgi:formiminotetrahydrofolate cyclodeaminase
MAAGLSVAQLDDAAELALIARDLCDRAAGLAQADAAAYGAVLSAKRDRDAEPEEKRRRVEQALVEATEVPLQLMELGAAVCELAARIAEEGNANLLGDAVAAALLAEAAVRADGALVVNNLGTAPDRERLGRSARALARAKASAAKAEKAMKR